MDGGYDEIYRKAPCIWGTQPGSLFTDFTFKNRDVVGARVLDVGCGEGKNAIYFARQGAIVDAFDVSEIALANARRAWPDAHLVKWSRCSLYEWGWESGAYDLVIAYGVLHCLPSSEGIVDAVSRFREATVRGGANVICTFNDRSQDLRAHPGLHPTLLPHDRIRELYCDWILEACTDGDLWETHPHSPLFHCHSLTRLIARKP